MHSLTRLLSLASVSVILVWSSAGAQAPAPGGSAEASSGALGGCEQGQSTIDLGVQVAASCGGTLGEAEATLDGGAVVFASAASSNANSGTFGGAELTYQFEIVPTGRTGGPSVPVSGIQFTVSFTAQAQTSFSTATVPIGDVSSASVSYEVYGYNDVSSGGIWPQVPCDTTTPCTVTAIDSIAVNTNGSINIAADCSVVGVGTCFTKMDPTITIAASFAPYYSVIDSSVSPIPEPSTLELVGAGLACLGFTQLLNKRFVRRPGSSLRWASLPN